MPAKDYILAVTPITNAVWICKPSKKDKNTMTYDRAEIDQGAFLTCVLQWAINRLDDGKDTVYIKLDDKFVGEIKIDRKALGLAGNSDQPPHGATAPAQE